MSKSAQSRAKQFAKRLDESGRYIGASLHRWGFPYKQGEYIPLSARLDAERAWRHALRAKQIEFEGNGEKS